MKRCISSLLHFSQRTYRSFLEFIFQTQRKKFMLFVGYYPSVRKSWCWYLVSSNKFFLFSSDLTNLISETDQYMNFNYNSCEIVTITSTEYLQCRLILIFSPKLYSNIQFCIKLCYWPNLPITFSKCPNLLNF